MLNCRASLGALQRRCEIVSASGNAARAYQLLGWRPIVPYTQTLTDVLADWREQTTNTGSLSRRTLVEVRSVSRG
jgi:hypothetical protein